MTLEVDFLPLATGAGANVLDQSDYAALAAISGGYQSGVASSAQVNKTLRQATFVSAAVANFISQQLSIAVLDDGNLANFITNLVAALNTAIDAPAANINYLPPGTGGQSRTVQNKLSEIVSALDYMTTAQKTNVLSNVGSIDVTAAIQAAALVSYNVRLPAGTYLVDTTQIALTCFHRVYGDGCKTIINSSLTVPVFDFAAPTVDSVSDLYLGHMAINAKQGWNVGGSTTSSFNTDGAIIGGVIEGISFVGTYGGGAGDTLFNTNQVRDTSNNAQPINTGSNLSAANTITDVAAYGICGRHQKWFRGTVRNVNCDGAGIAYAFEGSDICKIEGGRIQEVGLIGYENRIGSFGSQTHWYPREILQNRRAGGIIMNGTKFSHIEDCYYECYSDSACLAWWDGVEGAYLDRIRIDDPYYTGAGGGNASGTTPIMLLNNPLWNNKAFFNSFQKFSSFTVAAPWIRTIGFGSQDSNHPELFALESNVPFFPALVSENPGYRTGPPDYQRFDPTNCGYLVGGNFQPLWQVLNGEYVVYDATATTVGVRLDCKGSVSATYNLLIRALVASGSTITFTVEHHRQDGTLAETILNGVSIGGFVAGTFQTVTEALTFGQEPRAGDYIIVAWSSSSCELKGLRLIQ